MHLGDGRACGRDASLFVERVQPFVYTSLSDAAALYPQFNEQIPAEAEIIPAELRDRWFAALRRADAEGTLWVTMLSYVAAGVVAETAA